MEMGNVHVEEEEDDRPAGAGRPDALAGGPAGPNVAVASEGRECLLAVRMESAWCRSWSPCSAAAAVAMDGKIESCPAACALRQGSLWGAMAWEFHAMEDVEEEAAV